MTHDIRLNLGCGGRPLPGYLNVDRDDIEAMTSRYPDRSFDDVPIIYPFDIFNLPFPDSSISEVRAESLVEHLSFAEEPLFFNETRRVLRPGGRMVIQTTDFEAIARLWLDARDDWQDFYRSDPEAIAATHWFGQYSYAMDNRWGYLTAAIFGSQNGEGQFHRNCYTEGKLRAIMEHLGMVTHSVRYFRWKGDRDPMLELTAVKPNFEGNP